MCLPLSYNFTQLVVPKSFRYAQSRRRVKPPSDEGGGFAAGEDGGRETRSEIVSPPVFCFAKSSPLVRGGLSAHLTASAVVGQYT